MLNPLGSEPLRSLLGRSTSKAERHAAPPPAADAPLRTADASAPASGAGTRLVAAFAARCVPDLATRVRRDLEREGVVIEELGIGAAGEHVVVTVLVPAAARSLLQRLAERSRFDLSFLNSADATPDP